MSVLTELGNQMLQTRLGVFLAVMVTLPLCDLKAEQTKAIETVNRFLASVDKNDAIDAATKIAVVEAVTELRDDEFAIDSAITEGLAIIYPEFTKALELVGNDDTEGAIEAFEKLAHHTDPFLASESQYFIARAHVYDENYEAAIPALKQFEEKFSKDSVQNGNALYLQGIALANTLQNKDAIAALTNFIDQYPNASERMRVGAWRQLQIVSSIKKGTLGDVFQRMDFSRRRLALERTDQNTKIEQDEIVKMLNVMIKKAEDQEKKSSASSQKKPGSEDKPSEGEPKEGKGKGKSKSGKGSQNPDGFAKRTFGSGDVSDWSKLRDRERDPAFNAIKEKFPARYKELVEQYYKSFQKSRSR